MRAFIVAPRMKYLVTRTRGTTPNVSRPAYPIAFRAVGLTLDPPRGVLAIELNQGDTKSGRIARSDVARVCVESIYRYIGMPSRRLTVGSGPGGRGAASSRDRF